MNEIVALSLKVGAQTMSNKKLTEVVRRKILYAISDLNRLELSLADDNPAEQVASLSMVNKDAEIIDILVQELINRLSINNKPLVEPNQLDDLLSSRPSTLGGEELEHDLEELPHGEPEQSLFRFPG